MPKRSPVTIRGNRFDTMVAAAAHHGVTEGAVRAAARKGQASLDRVGLGQGCGRAVTIRGTVFTSITAAARALGVDHRTVTRAARAGQPALDRLGMRPTAAPIPVTVDGITYPSRSAASRALDVPVSSLR
ncbi:hypothetical protein vBDshSR4C_045 [Dinoroseobacter phage vB_DshS-R4C]|nr:hypothetical protein vBDshSR4C_045 [Dinoroseobacter phage vB_DshS-R4C]